MEYKKQYSELELLRITYRIGDVFGLMFDGGLNVEYCLLAQVNSFEIVLIGLRSGNRVNNPVIVKNVDNITQEEFKEIAGKFYLNHQLMDKYSILKFPIE